MKMGRIKLVLLLSYISIASISAAMITPALPEIKQSFDLTSGLLDWVISIFLLGYVVGQLIYGPLANRWGRLTALRSGLVLNLLGLGLSLIACKLLLYPLLLAGRMMAALGAASGLSCSFMLFNELLSPSQVKHAMSMAVISFTVGIGLAVSIGGVVTQYLGWQYCFYLLLGHGFLMLILTWQFPETLKKTQQIHMHSILNGYWQVLQSGQLIIYSLMVGFVSLISYGYSTAAPVYAQLVLNLSPSEYGYWNGVNMLGMLISGFLSAFLIKKWGEKTVLVLGMACLIPVVFALFFLAYSGLDSVLGFFSTTFLLYLLSGFLFPAASYFASNAASDRASASSMMSFINMGSAMIAVITMGYLPMPAIRSFAFMVLLFFMMISGLFFIELKRGRYNKAF